MTAEDVTGELVDTGDPYWLTVDRHIGDPGQYLYAPSRDTFMHILAVEPYREGTGWRFKVVTAEAPS